MERVGLLAEQNPELEDWIWDERGTVLAYSGHLVEARKASARAVDLALQSGRKEAAAQHEANAAIREILFGNVQEGRTRALAAHAAANGRESEYGAALSLAWQGDVSAARTIMDGLERKLPQDTVVRFNYAPALHAALAIARHDPAMAVDLLRPAATYELGWLGCCSVGFSGSLYPIYLRGMAFLDASMATEAALEFQKILAHPGIIIADPIGAVARLQRGRALKLAGNRSGAIRAYEDFLDLWKDADPDIPVLKTARAEYAQLH